MEDIDIRSCAGFRPTASTTLYKSSHRIAVRSSCVIQISPRLSTKLLGWVVMDLGVVGR